MCIHEITTFLLWDLLALLSCQLFRYIGVIMSLWLPFLMKRDTAVTRLEMMQWNSNWKEHSWSSSFFRNNVTVLRYHISTSHLMLHRISDRPINNNTVSTFFPSFFYITFAFSHWLYPGNCDWLVCQRKSILLRPWHSKTSYRLNCNLPVDGRVRSFRMYSKLLNIRIILYTLCLIRLSSEWKYYQWTRSHDL